MQSIREDIIRFKREFTRVFIDIDAESKVPCYLHALEIYSFMRRKGQDLNDLPPIAFACSMTALGPRHYDTLEQTFDFLVERVEHDGVAYRIVQLIAAETYNNERYPVIPEVLRRCIKDIIQENIPYPTNESKRKTFLRNVMIVRLLDFLCHQGIAPTRNPATESEQYGMDIVGEIDFLTPASIAGIWKDKKKYWGRTSYDWEFSRGYYIHLAPMIAEDGYVGRKGCWYKPRPLSITA